jgi:hypothetical protein
VVAASGVPVFGPEFNESMRRILKAMEPILKQHQETMAGFSAQLAASGFLEQQQETLRKFNETICQKQLRNDRWRQVGLPERSIKFAVSGQFKVAAYNYYSDPGIY